MLKRLRLPAVRRAPETSTPVVCPVCGSPVVWDYTCHTYQQGGRWMACLPCDSAIVYSCAGDPNGEGCGWSFDHGLNPGNPRAEANEKRRPPWLITPRPDSDSRGDIRPVTGVRWIIDDPEDGTDG